MNDVSDLIYFWITCSNDLWRKYFLNRPNGADEFPEIEDALFRVIVVRSVFQVAPTLMLGNLPGLICVHYRSDLMGERQVCHRQKAGNIFCWTEMVTLEKKTEYVVKSIDTMGTMMDSDPYVEVIVGEKFILESPKNLRFLLAC